MGLGEHLDCGPLRFLPACPVAEWRTFDLIGDFSGVAAVPESEPVGRIFQRYDGGDAHFLV